MEDIVQGCAKGRSKSPNPNRSRRRMAILALAGDCSLTLSLRTLRPGAAATSLELEPCSDLPPPGQNRPSLRTELPPAHARPRPPPPFVPCKSARRVAVPPGREDGGSRWSPVSRGGGVGWEPRTTYILLLKLTIRIRLDSISEVTRIQIRNLAHDSHLPLPRG